LGGSHFLFFGVAFVDFLLIAGLVLFVALFSALLAPLYVTLAAFIVIIVGITSITVFVIKERRIHKESQRHNSSEFVVQKVYKVGTLISDTVHYFVCFLPYTLSHTLNMTDHSKLKVLVLVLVYIMCGYTAFQKFYGSGATVTPGFKQPTIDYSVCNKMIAKSAAGTGIGKEEKMSRCKRGVDKANKEAKSKCAQYFSQLATCQKRTRSPCHTQFSNFENCVNTILTGFVDEELEKPRI
jgi:hypothetical protein